MSDILIRRSNLIDIPLIEQLYKKVAAIEGGLARTEAEITREYIEHFVSKSIVNGIEFVATDRETNSIVGDIHCFGSGIKAFAHVLGDLTIAVHPDFQGQGIGKMLFGELLDEVTDNRPHILRVELIARESNTRALRFYESLGFEPEGRLVKRIRSVGGGFEDDVLMAWHRS
jgi:ribosomal protein S18 acetylase RimI-like enzyme